jgi:hypothetical protein
MIALTKNNFTYSYCIGKGGFGKVWKVERKEVKVTICDERNVEGAYFNKKKSQICYE